MGRVNAARGLQAEPGDDRLVIRIYPWATELKNFLDPEPSPPEPKSLDKVSTDAERQLITWYNKETLNRYQDNNPALDRMSLSDRTRDMILRGPHTFHVMIDTWREIREDPASATINRKSHREEALRVMKACIADAEAIWDEWSTAIKFTTTDELPDCSEL
ncbi:hypothetical protein ACHAQJ_006195 [Trichoderma viride]